MRVITLGEILLRFSTSEEIRIKNTDEFRVCYGGAETNVGISLSQFGHKVSVASVLPECNPLSKAVLSRMHGYDVDTDLIIEQPGRLGTYYLEQGNSVRGSQVTYDRKYSSIAILEKLCWDLDEIFKGVDLLHISGIVPALSKKWQSWTVEIVKKAKEYGCLISFDMNYRSKLWEYEEAYPCFQQILPYVDILSAGRLDAIHFLQVANAEEEVSLEEIYRRVKEKYENIKVLYSTKRNVFSTNHHELQGFYVGEDNNFVLRIKASSDGVTRLYGFNDRYFPDGHFTTQILSRSNKKEEQFKAGDTVELTLFRVSETYMNYIRVLSNNATNNAGLLSIPNRAKGNIFYRANPKENPLGAFRVAQYSKVIYVIQ